MGAGGPSGYEHFTKAKLNGIESQEFPPGGLKSAEDSKENQSQYSHYMSGISKYQGLAGMGGAFGAFAADSVSDENLQHRPDMTKGSQ